MNEKNERGEGQKKKKLMRGMNNKEGAEEEVAENSDKKNEAEGAEEDMELPLRLS